MKLSKFFIYIGIGLLPLAALESVQAQGVVRPQGVVPPQTWRPSLDTDEDVQVLLVSRIRIKESALKYLRELNCVENEEGEELKIYDVLGCQVALARVLAVSATQPQQESTAPAIGDAR